MLLLFGDRIRTLYMNIHFLSTNYNANNSRSFFFFLADFFLSLVLWWPYVRDYLAQSWFQLIWFFSITQASTLMLNKIYLSYFINPSSRMNILNPHLENIITASIANVIFTRELCEREICEHLYTLFTKQNLL